MNTRFKIALIFGGIITLSIAYYFTIALPNHNKQEEILKQQQLELEKQKHEAEKKAEAEVVAKKIEEENAPDTIPPKIENFCFGTLKKNEERVCISIDSWNGYLDSVNSIPITGKIEGDIKSITVDGKKIKWDENNQIYQRINLYVYGGLNKYKVVAEDMNGNKSTGYVQTNAENNSNDYNINVNQ
jgi:hypothetical protein